MCGLERSEATGPSPCALYARVPRSLPPTHHGLGWWRCRGPPGWASHAACRRRCQSRRLPRCPRRRPRRRQRRRLKACRTAPCAPSNAHAGSCGCGGECGRGDCDGRDRWTRLTVAVGDSHMQYIGTHLQYNVIRPSHSDAHLQYSAARQPVHRRVVPALPQLKQAAPRSRFAFSWCLPCTSGSVINQKT